MSAAESLIELRDADPVDSSVADDDLIAGLASDSPLRRRFETLRADNARYRAEKAARDAPPPERWLRLKPGASIAQVPYETARVWAARGLIKSRKDGGVFVEMGSLIARRIQQTGK